MCQLRDLVALLRAGEAGQTSDVADGRGRSIADALRAMALRVNPSVASEAAVEVSTSVGAGACADTDASVDGWAQKLRMAFMASWMCTPATAAGSASAILRDGSESASDLLVRLGMALEAGFSAVGLERRYRPISMTGGKLENSLILNLSNISALNSFELQITSLLTACSPFGITQTWKM